jgi:hypothetical protein
MVYARNCRKLSILCILFSHKTIHAYHVLTITDQNSFDLDCTGNISLG